MTCLADFIMLIIMENDHCFIHTDDYSYDNSDSVSSTISRSTKWISLTRCNDSTWHTMIWLSPYVIDPYSSLYTNTLLLLTMNLFDMLSVYVFLDDNINVLWLAFCWRQYYYYYSIYEVLPVPIADLIYYTYSSDDYIVRYLLCYMILLSSWGIS